MCLLICYLCKFLFPHGKGLYFICVTYAYITDPAQHMESKCLVNIDNNMEDNPGNHSRYIINVGLINRAVS